MGIRPNQRIRLCYSGTVQDGWMPMLCTLHRHTKDSGSCGCLRLKFDKRGREDHFATARVFAPPTCCSWLISVQHRERRLTRVLQVPDNRLSKCIHDFTLGLQFQWLWIKRLSAQNDQYIFDESARISTYTAFSKVR